MRFSEYLCLKSQVLCAGFSEEIEWAQNIKAVTKPLYFWLEYAHVVVNSGMKAQVAEKILRHIYKAKAEGLQTLDVFKHQGKAKAIDFVWNNQHDVFYWYYRSDDKLVYLETLPWIGPITKYHLARNLGADVCKPDRHLVRISKKYGLTPAKMCEQLSIETGERIGVVDAVIWRAANLGFC